MISQSQYALIEAIKSSLFSVVPDFPPNTNWEEVIAEAKSQTVLGLIDSVIPVHDESADQCKAIYMRLMYEQDRLVNLLDSYGIPFVVLKGSSVAVYYPKPYKRTMGDIDILVPRDRFIEAALILESNGYINIHCKDVSKQVSKHSRHIGYSKNGIEIELHHHFSSWGYDIDDLLEEAIRKREYRVIDNYKFPVLPDIENGLVLIGHINQHLNENGLGLRQIIDWMMYLHTVCGIESWEKTFTAYARNAGLLTLATNVTRMCNTYFGLPDTLANCIDDNLSDELLTILLTDGNWGRREDLSFSNDERRMRNATYLIKRNGVFEYFTDVGFGLWKHGNDKSKLKLLAFFIGLSRQTAEGIKALFRNKDVSKQLKGGKKKYELYKKLGVRSEKDDSL